MANGNDKRNGFYPEACRHGISYTDRQCPQCYPQGFSARGAPAAAPPTKKATEKAPATEFTAADMASADAYANGKEPQYSNRWHCARDGYLCGMARGRSNG